MISVTECLSEQLKVSLGSQPEAEVHGMVPSTFRAGLPTSASLAEKLTYRHTLRLDSWVTRPYQVDRISNHSL